MSDGRIVAVDLFCGAGGFSTGLAETCEQLDRKATLYAINHWDRAIETHEANHPWATQFHAKVEELHPPNVIDEDEVDLLVAGPECTHFSNARGGRPVSEQQRASPWHVVDWLEKLDVRNFLVENVTELESWGPVDDEGQPTRNGDVFEAWINALHAIGYSVDWTTLNAADYGDPTSRDRLFIAGSRDKRASFPEPTHSENGEVPGTDPWRPAADVIDWSDPGGSIWTRDIGEPRKQPLKNSTMQRIAEGIRRHCDDRLEPLADALADVGPEDVKRLRQNVVSLSDAPTVAEAVDHPFLVASPGREAPGLASPYVLRQQSGGVPSPVHEDSMPTISRTGSIGLVDPRPLVMPRNGPYRGLHSNSLYRPEDRPLHTVTARNTDGYLVTPSLVRYSHGGRALSVENPMPTIATERGGVFALSEPYLCPLYNGRDEQRPRTRRVDRPLMTVPASKSPAGLATPLVTPFIDDYEGPPASVSHPLGTVTSRDRFALCVPEHYPWGLDVRYRMLQPRELKQAQGFPPDYEIVGNKRETTEQIGNAVPVGLAQSLCECLLVDDAPDLRSFGGDERARADGGGSR